MAEDYRERFAEIELRVIETYFKLILEYYPKLEKAERDHFFKGL